MPVERSESIMNLALALSKAQGELPAVPMRSTNPFLKNKYADLGSVIETCKPVLSKHELSVSQVVFNDEQRVGVTTILMHGGSGEWISSTLSLPISETKGSLAQAVGGLITYLRRYSLSSILGVHTEEDTDGNDKKTKALAAAQSEPLTPRQNLVKSILEKCTELGGSKNSKLLTLLREYEPNANPNKIKDDEKLAELYKKLTEMK